ncbi:MAG: hypothetical protein J6V09_01200, partial [Clostridia bacterium]|nr:hypothetical protein [Clostridia bacterium]
LYRIAALAAIYRVLAENISSMIFAKIIHIDKKKVGHIINVFLSVMCPIFFVFKVENLHGFLFLSQGASH